MTNPDFMIQTEEENSTYGRFVIEPLVQGFGQTLGNSLRRVLLSSLPGCAVTSIKVDGVKHEFQTLEGLKEDIIELILNIKKVRLKLLADSPAKLFLSVRGPKEVTALDIDQTSDVEIINRDQPLASISDTKSLKAELTVEKGYGYSPSDERRAESLGEIPIDALFSPVTRVNYRIESTRVGRMTNLDKLILEIWTDGTILPLSALKEASKILVSYFLEIYEPKAKIQDQGVAVTPGISDEVLKMTIEELDLPTRISNSLKNGGIETVGQLLGTPKKSLLKIKNLGAKSLDIVEEKLREKGVALSV